jgi:diacylglycerol kinase family enzyme
MGIGVLVNPRSRRNRKRPGAVLDLARRIGDRGIVRASRSIEELYTVAEEYKRLGIDVLAISGGDGTNHITLSAILDVYAGAPLPAFCFLRGGTMNTVARSVGVPRGKPETLLPRLVRAYTERGKGIGCAERHVLRVGKDYGFLFGTGAVHGFLAEYYRAPEPSPLVAAKTLAAGVGSTLIGGEVAARMTAPFRGSVEIDGEPVWDQRDYLAVAGGTIDQMGLGFKPFPRYAERAGAFHLLGIHASPSRFVRQLPRIFRGVSMGPASAYEATCARARLRSADGPVRYIVDGDLHATPDDVNELDVAVGPRVRIVTDL